MVRLRPWDEPQLQLRFCRLEKYFRDSRSSSTLPLFLSLFTKLSFNTFTAARLPRFKVWNFFTDAQISLKKTVDFGWLTFLGTLINFPTKRWTVYKWQVKTGWAPKENIPLILSKCSIPTALWWHVQCFFWSLCNSDTLSLQTAINTNVRQWKLRYCYDQHRNDIEIQLVLTAVYSCPGQSNVGSLKYQHILMLNWLFFNTKICDLTLNQHFFSPDLKNIFVQRGINAFCHVGTKQWVSNGRSFRLNKSSIWFPWIKHSY